MPRYFKSLIFPAAFILAAAILLAGCGQKSAGKPEATAPPATESTAGSPSEAAKEGTPVTESTVAQPSESAAPGIDLNAVKPDESGKIMVVMFHNFVDTYVKGDKAYTTTFKDFAGLLETLYDSGYRLISLSDYMSGNITTAPGYIPMVFTFDDGTAGQFNLAEENGALKANRQSAVGIMEEFNKTHPDFGLRGTFFVNLGNSTFAGKGTVGERLKYLVDEGFEIGNHTYTHINLKQAKSAAEIEKEIGGNQKKMYELIQGYTFSAFALPYGLPSQNLQQYVIKGEFEGVSYENKGILEVGWDPALSPFSPKLNLLSIHRVRASGITPVDADLAWWLKGLKRDKQFVSDGDPATVTVPKGKEASIDTGRLNGRKLVTY